MGTLTCKIRQRAQKLQREKSRCFAKKRRKLESSKIRVLSPVGSFNQRDQGFEFPQTIRPRVVALNDSTVCGAK